METIELQELFKAQALLDKTIARNHHISYETTREKRSLALIVEIGELANVTRCFKYWSNKPMEAKDVVLDEYADGLHFFLSLGIDIGTEKDVYVIDKPNNDLTAQFHKIYQSIDDFVLDPINLKFIRAFTNFLSLLPLLGYSWQDLKEAYYKKLDKNYVRQETNY